MILAIDFDGTIVTDNFPFIGELRQGATETLQQLEEDGHTIILNTCRCGDLEKDAREFLEENEIPFHFFNENDPEKVAMYGTDSRKISADLYIDDKNISGLPNWESIYEMITNNNRSMNNNTERRFLEAPVHIEKREDGQESRRVVGYAVKWNELSKPLGWGFRERFLPGAFDECMDQDIVALFNHDRNLVLARSTQRQGTLSLSSDAVGLRYEFDAPSNTAGNDLLVSLERSDVRHSSFAFSVATDGESWVEDQEHGEIRTIKKAKYLFDVSPVTYPAYPQTEVARRSYESFKGHHIKNWEQEQRQRELQIMEIEN